MKAFRSHGKVLPLYIHEPSLIAQPDISRQHQRDDDVRAWCKTHSVELVETGQNGIARGADLSKRFAPLPFASNPANEIPLAKGTDKPYRQKGGRKAAQKILDGFFNVRNISRYPSQLSSPNTAWDGCSRISTYLAYGIVSDREVFQALEAHPELETQCMLPQFNGVREAEFDEALFTAWSSGLTGVSYIDAAMRCLNDSG